MAVPSNRPIRNCLYGRRIGCTRRHSYQPVSRALVGAPTSARVQEGCARSRGALTLLNAPQVVLNIVRGVNCHSQLAELKYVKRYILLIITNERDG